MVAEHWYIRIGDDQLGPMSKDDVENLAKRGVVNTETSVSCDAKTWQRASSVDAFGFAKKNMTAKSSPPRPGRLARSPERSLSDSWHVRIYGGRNYGPITKVELDRWVADGRLTSASKG